MDNFYYSDYIELDTILNSQHYAFREVTEPATFLIERSKLPELPNVLKKKVSFQV